jgi:UMF1 family MFS transporter
LFTKEIFSWTLYDWGNSAFATVMMAAVLPVFFSQYIAADIDKVTATAYWGYANTGVMLFVALLAPFLGAVADVRAKKLTLLAVFAALGGLASIGLGFISAGAITLTLVLYMLGRLAFAGGNIFYDSLLPHIAQPQMHDRVSSWGYAGGYLAGGLVLALGLWWMQAPQFWGFTDTVAAIKGLFILVGIWWILLTLPILRNVSEPEALQGPRNDLVLYKAAWRQMLAVFSELSRNREVLKFLLAFFLYNDGIGTIMVMAAILGAEIGIPSEQLLAAILAVQFIGIPATYGFAVLAERISTKRAIIVALTGYLGISFAAFFVETGTHFWILAISVGLVQGGAQALSRSFYAGMIPAAKSAEYFSFFDVFAKFSSILGPAIFAFVGMPFGSSRYGVLALIVFFVLGIWLLSSLRTQSAIENAVSEVK